MNRTAPVPCPRRGRPVPAPAVSPTPPATAPSPIAMAAFATAAILGGCSYQLVSPPARMINLESAKTAAPGETVVGVHGAGYAAIFDPGAAIASAGVRRGIAKGVEVDADASWAHVSYEGFPNINRNIYAARVGAKMSGWRDRVALFAGAGGGYAPAAGAFSAIDVGGAVSYPNCYLVPFGNATVFGSQPIGARQVDFRNADGTLASSDKASFTYGFSLGTGLELPLDRARCRQGLTAARLQLGVAASTLIPSEGAITTTTSTSSDGGVTTMTDTRGGRYGVVGLALGLEVPF